MTNSNRKCGEITFCSQVGKRVYALNCLYCPQICLQWEMFINHLEQEHAKYLTLDYIVQPETSKTPIKMEVHEVVTEECVAQLNNKKRKLEESILSDDPLESENSTSEICMESSIKIEQEEECPPNLNLFETEENSSEMSLPPADPCTPGIQPKPPYNSAISPCQSCYNLIKVFEDTYKDMKKVILSENNIIMNSMAELRKDILHQEANNNNLRKAFPITTVHALNELNNTINDDNHELYVKTMKSLLKGNLSKTLTAVISTNVCMEVNINGIHGKTRLKNFKSFFQALTDACSSLGSADSEKDLKNALKIIKKRHIQAKCIKNKKISKIN